MLHDRARMVNAAVETLADEVGQITRPLKTAEDLDPLIIGQLVRKHHSDDGVMLVGFGSHHGSVIAGQSWGAPMERMKVPDALAGSWEDILHQVSGDQLLLFHQEKLSDDFHRTRGHRAIGVVYHGEYESRGNYVPTALPKRYDAFLYIDETEALHPLHIEPQEINPPDTFPWGI